jgi:ferredoxin
MKQGSKSHSVLSLEKQILTLESRISEGLICPPGQNPEPGDHLFGRPGHIVHSEGLEALSGWSSAGLRSAVLLRSRIPGSDLTHLIRQRSPVVILIQTEGAYPLNLDIPQLVASSAQEAIDFTLIAHRIAEYSLGPVIVQFPPLEEEVSFDDAHIRSFLQSPDDQIESPSPAQEIIFGRYRRRIPQLHSLDLPTAMGMQKSVEEEVRETAGRREYFHEHINEIITDSLKAFQDITGRAYSLLSTAQTEKADRIILCWGRISTSIRELLKTLDHPKKNRIGLVELNFFHPSPTQAFQKIPGGKKEILLLQPLAENSQAGTGLYSLFQNQATGPGKKMPAPAHGFYPPSFKQEDLLFLLTRMLEKDPLPSPFYLGIHFSQSHSPHPQHEVLLQTINRSYPELLQKGLSERRPDTEAFSTTTSFPTGIADYLDQGPPYSRLSRFLHDTAAFYQEGRQAEQFADPFQSLPLTPAATAGLHTAKRDKELPLFLPENCTACGECMVYCPHAALPSIAFTPEQWIRGGMTIAAQQKRPISQLTPFVKKLAKKIADRLKEERSFRKIGHLLPDAFERLLEESGASGEKAQKLKEAGTILAEIIQDFPVARSQALFSDYEEKQSGTGSLFSLLLDLNACTGCGICTEVCPDKALIMKKEEEEDRKNASQLIRKWEQLPDTPGTLIQELIEQQSINPFGALFLSRNFYLSLRGGREGKQLSAKVLLHLITGFSESVGQARTAELLSEIDEQIKSLSEKIHKELSDALPSGDFSALLESLKQEDGKRKRLDQILDDLGEREPLKLLNTEVLSRRSELVEDLKEWRRLLTSGPTGNGRARYSLAFLTKKWDWAARHPWNAFTAPVSFLSDRQVKEQAESLLFGQIRHQLDNIRLLRRAKLEAKGKYFPQTHDPELAMLNWPSLSDTEKRWIAPLLVIADETQLDSPELQKLLTTQLPIKIFLLDSGEEAVTGEKPSLLEQRFSLLLRLSLFTDIQALGGSLAKAEELFESMLDSWQPDQAAFFHLYTPASEWAWPQFSRLALASRAFPHYRIKSGKNNSLASRISLDQNPEPEKDWASDESGQIITYAHWLFNQPGWEEEFTTANEKNHLPIQEYLKKSDPSGLKATISVLNERGEQQNWTVSERVISKSRELLKYWNRLREMAGLLNPFPEKVLEKAKEEAAARYEKEMEKVRKAYEEKLSKQEEETLAKTKQRLKEELLKLTKK